MAKLNKQKIKTDLAWASGANLLEKAIGYLILAQLTRYLSQEVAGQFFYALTLTNFLVVFANMGTGHYFYREFAAAQETAVIQLGTALSLRLRLSAAYYLLVIGVVWLFQPALLPVMSLTAVFIGLEYLAYPLTAFFLAKQAVNQRVWVVVSSQLLLVALISYGIYLQLPFLLLLGSYILANLAQILLAWWFVHRYYGRLQLSWHWPTAWQILQISFPFFLLNLLTIVVARVDTLMLSWFDSFVAVANYEASYRLLDVSRFLVRPALMIFFPIAAPLAAQRQWPKLQALFHKVMWLALGLGTAVVLGINLLAPWLIPLVFGDKYETAVSLTQLLFLSAPFVFTTLFATALANALHLEKTVVKGTIVVVLLNISLNLFAIPRWSAMGAAAATVFSEAALALWLIYLNTITLRQQHKFPGESSLHEQTI